MHACREAAYAVHGKGVCSSKKIWKIVRFGLYFDQVFSWNISKNYHFYINTIIWMILLARLLWGIKLPEKKFVNMLQMMHFDVCLDKIWYKKIIVFI